MDCGVDENIHRKVRIAGKHHLEDIRRTYEVIRPEIETRLSEFGDVWRNGTDRDLFLELVFCLFTPQSRARSCWKALGDITENGLVFTGASDEIADNIRAVRFRFNKSRYLVAAREMFTENDRISIRPRIAEWDDVMALRDWLVTNIKGLGYKEASHFLRNIGMGHELAILDRHILKNLVLLDVIGSVPGTLSVNKYKEVENRMRFFSQGAGIPMDHLDLLLWYREAGEIFK